MGYYDNERPSWEEIKEAIIENPIVRVGAGLIAMGLGGAGLYIEATTTQKTIEDPFFLLLTGSAALAGLGLTVEGVVRGVAAVIDHIPGRRRRRNR